MALAQLSEVTIKADGKGNQNIDTAYYEIDRKIVLDQEGARSFGLVNVIFDTGLPDKNITVFAAKNSDDNVLPILALPCPPYYREQIVEAVPGQYITEGQELHKV